MVFWQNGWVVDSDEQGAVSVGFPSQASDERALLQLRNLNFLQLDEDGSHSDHSPHSDQAPAAATQGISSLTFSKSSPTLAQVKGSKPKIYWVWFVGWVGWFNEIISPDPSIASLLIDCFLPVLLKLPVTCVTNPHIDHNPPHNPLHHAIFITSQILTEIFLYSWFWLFHISPCVEKYWRLHFNHETATTLSYFCFNSVLTLNSNRYIHLY